MQKRSHTRSLGCIPFRGSAEASHSGIVATRDTLRMCVSIACVCSGRGAVHMRAERQRAARVQEPASPAVSRAGGGFGVLPDCARGVRATAHGRHHTSGMPASSHVAITSVHNCNHCTTVPLYHWNHCNHCKHCNHCAQQCTTNATNQHNGRIRCKPYQCKRPS